MNLAIWLPALWPKKGQPVAPDVEAWFQADRFGGQPNIGAQWADAHNSLAQAWVKADPRTPLTWTHGAGRIPRWSPNS